MDLQVLMDQLSNHKKPNRRAGIALEVNGEPFVIPAQWLGGIVHLKPEKLDHKASKICNQRCKASGNHLRLDL